MNTSFRERRTLAGSAVLVSCSLLLSGCGGGADTEPTVTMKSSKVEQSSSNGASQAPSNGGSSGGDRQPGRITGTIQYDGDPPSLSPVVALANIAADQRNVCTPDVIGNETLVVNPQSKGVANVFVYLDRAPRGVKVPEGTPDPVLFDNKQCRFVPHALFVQVGQTVNVSNSDPFAHNTKVDAAGFNSTIGANAAPTPLVYRRSESVPVNVNCSFHTWMTGYHLVLDHPWGAVTDPDGRFEIPELPGGDYQLRIWHEPQNLLDRGFKVTVNGDVDVGELRYPAAKFASIDGPRPKTVTIATR